MVGPLQQLIERHKSVHWQRQTNQCLFHFNMSTVRHNRVKHLSEWSDSWQRDLRFGGNGCGVAKAF